MIAQVAALPMATSSSGDARSQQNQVQAPADIPREALRQGFRPVQIPPGASGHEATSTPRSEIILFFILNSRHLFCRLQEGMVRLAQAMGEAYRTKGEKGVSRLLEDENWHVGGNCFRRMDQKGNPVEVIEGYDLQRAGNNALPPATGTQPTLGTLGAAQGIGRAFASSASNWLVAPLAAALRALGLPGRSSRSEI